MDTNRQETDSFMAERVEKWGIFIRNLVLEPRILVDLLTIASRNGTESPQLAACADDASPSTFAAFSLRLPISVATEIYSGTR